MMMTICPACEGTGQVHEDRRLMPCSRCNGNGEVPVVEMRCIVCEETWRWYPADVSRTCERCGTRLIRVDAMRE